MPHPLQAKVRSVRRLAQRVRLVYGLAWMIVAALAAALVVGLVDYFLRSSELGVRFIFSLGVLACIGWAAWRFLWPSLASHLSDIQVAQRIQRRWPQLNDRLSSSLEFLSQEEGDHMAGSPALRRTVVAEATAQIDGLPLAEAIDIRRPLPALIAAGVLLLLTILLWLSRRKRIRDGGWAIARAVERSAVGSLQRFTIC